MNTMLMDELTIRNLLTDVCRLADDSPSVQDISAIFTHDGIWKMGEHAWQGRDGIANGLQTMRDNSGVGPGSGTRHILSNLAVRVADDGTASAHSCLLLVRSGASPAILFSVQYQDKLVQEAGHWLISRREVLGV